MVFVIFKYPQMAQQSRRSSIIPVSLSVDFLAITTPLLLAIAGIKFKFDLFCKPSG